jgi:hypothetical protein
VRFLETARQTAGRTSGTARLLNARGFDDARRDATTIGAPRRTASVERLDGRCEDTLERTQGHKGARRAPTVEDLFDK